MPLPSLRRRPTSPPDPDPSLPTAVFLHAHPDDEALLTAGTMATLAARGHRVVLLVATAGEAGLADAALQATDLGARRTAELAASAAALGVARTEVLGYADSGLGPEPGPVPPPGHLPRLADAAVDDVAVRVAAVLDAEDAALLTSYDAAGGYGHPDHVAIHRIGARAAQLAARTPVLLEATAPRDRLLAAATRVNRLLPRRHRVDLGPWQSAYSATTDITHVIDVRGQARARRAAMAAHASQATGGIRTLGVFRRIPSPLFGWAFGREWYRQPGLPPRDPRDRYRDVFATL
ncbi:PIG-L deacetylase family protein [Nakamurella flava]|uniref:PIG-L deacetylase family protein n=1 Tax=Nakamurella flava TaxID=2576308 RepID=UPI00197C17EE|nr:PIG-L family deacetylase [Nakamurella flava]